MVENGVNQSSVCAWLNGLTKFKTNFVLNNLLFCLIDKQTFCFHYINLLLTNHHLAYNHWHKSGMLILPCDKALHYHKNKVKQMTGILFNFTLSVYNFVSFYLV